MRLVGRVAPERSESRYRGLLQSLGGGAVTPETAKVRENRPFAELLDERFHQQSLDEFQLLIQRLDDAGRKLVESFKVPDFESYRLQLAVILRRLIHDNLVLKHLPGNVQVIDVINGEVDYLYQQLLSGQARKLRVLQQIDKIRSLLVDAVL